MLGVLAPHKTELFTAAIFTVCSDCRLLGLGNSGTPLNTPHLHPSCTKKARPDVSTTAFYCVTDLVEVPLHKQGGGTHVTLMCPLQVEDMQQSIVPGQAEAI